MEFVDLHCHIMPYVDDGAEDTDEAIELLRSELEQGVTELCLTPHLRQGMFNSTDEKVLTGFERLKNEAEEAGLSIRMHLSREYYWDDQFRRLLEKGNVIPMGSHKAILTEFSYSADKAALQEAVKTIRDSGYLPIIAHAERYFAVQEDPAFARELISMGALIQMNASSLLGLEGWKLKHVAKQMLKQKNVHVIASDSHDTDLRTPNLKRAADYVERKYGSDAVELLFRINPRAILSEE